MRPADVQEAKRLAQALAELPEQNVELPGLTPSRSLDVLVEQLIESGRRNEYIQRLRTRDLRDAAAQAGSETFDPLMAAILHARRGEIDDACWMVFLYVHFGKHKDAGWRYARDVYGKLGQDGTWDWLAVSADVRGFRAWLDANATELQREGSPRGFGNHRKYESLAGWTQNGTGQVVASYIQLIENFGGHVPFLEHGTKDRTPEDGFERLFHELSRVHRFGRIACFDYLSLISKLCLAQIRPGHAYLEKASGPLIGARLLFGSCPGGRRRSPTELRPLMAKLQEALGVSFDVLEDALCNWQKSPGAFRPFRG